MNKTNRYNILIIIISAILVTVLYNYKLIFFILEQLETKGFSEMDDRGMIRIYIGVISTVVHFILFCVIAFFNYSWKDKLINPRMSKIGKIPLIILGNFLIFYVAALSEHTLVNNLDADIGKRLITGYFLWANISIGVVALSEAYFIILIRKIKTAEMENIRLQEERAKAELASLKEQISPHFFFNTLNALSSVIRTEKKSDSLDFVENMSQVYRYILDSESTDTVTIAEELEFLDAYSHLLKKRFGDNLQIEINIDEQVKKQKIPPMALQILIENVVKHNKLSSENPIHFSIENRMDYLYIQNNVNKKNSAGGHGVGLANLNKRYRVIADCEIEIKETKDNFLVILPIIKP